ncbi:hypothetical protein [Nonomuraea dietziae]|uniref:hypothetical protein n=1 Tax=Nonomuraea dietziae TaxID=65515 RepID=UPI0031D91EDA
MLVPDTPARPTQAVDVRDPRRMAARRRGEGERRHLRRRRVLSFPFGEWIELSRAVGGHTPGPVVTAESAWLLANGVAEYMGPESLPMWLVEPGWEGWSARNGSAGRAAGLRHRPRAEMLADTLAWEREQGLDRKDVPALSAQRERELLHLVLEPGERAPDHAVRKQPEEEGRRPGGFPPYGRIWHRSTERRKNVDQGRRS